MKVINIGIMAHIDAGKTSLTENFLFKSGAINVLGKVDSKNTTMDNLKMERSRGITIRESTTSFIWNGVKINIVDTPGHFDFFSEVIKSLYVVDCVILIISAVEGIQTQTDRIIRLLTDMGIPYITFINKIDRVGSDYSKIFEEMRYKYKTDYVQMQNMDFNLIELMDSSLDHEVFEENILSMSLHDKGCLEDYQEGNGKFYDYYLSKKSLFWSQKVYPVFLGSVKYDLGIQEILDFISELVEEKSNGNIVGAQKVSAIIYKIEYLENKKLCFFRLYKGSISKLDDVKIGEEELKIRNLFTIKNTKIVKCDTVYENDIGILVDIDNIKIGDIIGEMDEKIRTIVMNEPCYFFTIFSSNIKDRIELVKALEKITLEDPSISFKVASNKIMVSICGEIQKEYIIDKLESQYKINFQIGDVKLKFKETICKRALGSIGFMQSKNHLNAAIQFEILPQKRGSGVKYISEVSSGYLSKPFQNAVREGVFKGLENGVKGGELTDIKIIFKKAIYDSVSSTPSDFRKLAPEVIQKIIEKTGTEILIPYTKITLSVQESFMGGVIEKVLLYHGKINDILNVEDFVEIHCIVKMKYWNYLLTSLNSITGGTFEYKTIGTIYDQQDKI